MVTVADIKKDLAGWPDDVVEQWLHYFANEPDCGWPPPEPLGEHRWKHLLGGKPLSWWKNVTWKKEKVKCDLASLGKKARVGVNEIVAEISSGKADATTMRRVAHSWRYIRENGVFPRALVTMKKSDGLSLIDGSHRMAAFHLIQQLPDAELAKLNVGRPALEQEIWVGTHSAGEVPDG